MVASGTDELLAQMRRGSIEFCVLALLRSGDRYGFDITRELTAADGLVTSEGTVYPLLTRLRNDGLVRTYWQESNVGPPRRYYRITPEGEEALTPFIEQWERFRNSVDKILSREKSQ
jgi:PadR family transcriptional regulator, regulatory protein PadR